MSEDPAQTRQTIVDGYTQVLVARYGERFSAEQLEQIKQGIGGLVDAAETLRRYPLTNEDEPVTVFQPQRREG